MSLNLILLRDLHAPPKLTLGMLQVGQHRLHTIERAWIPNPAGGLSGARFESCVGAGVYRLVPHRSEKYGSVWALVSPALDVYHFPGDVPKGREASSRVACLIHAANYWNEILGCIAPGRARSKQANGEWMVSQSRDALNVIKTVVGAKVDLTIEIRWADGVGPNKEAQTL